MTVEIRIPEQDEQQAWFRACEASFSDEIHEEDVERDRKMIPAERMFGAYDDGAIVGDLVPTCRCSSESPAASWRPPA